MRRVFPALLVLLVILGGTFITAGLSLESRQVEFFGYVFLFCAFVLAIFTAVRMALDARHDRKLRDSLRPRRWDE